MDVVGSGRTCTYPPAFSSTVIWKCLSQLGTAIQVACMYRKFGDRPTALALAFPPSTLHSVDHSALAASGSFGTILCPWDARTSSSLPTLPSAKPVRHLDITPSGHSRDNGCPKLDDMDLLDFTLLLWCQGHSRDQRAAVRISRTMDGLDGDTNGDGTLDSAQDQFAEIVNSGASSVDSSGYTISDSVHGTQ